MKKSKSKLFGEATVATAKKKKNTTTTVTSRVGKRKADNVVAANDESEEEDAINTIRKNVAEDEDDDEDADEDEADDEADDADDDADEADDDADDEKIDDLDIDEDEDAIDIVTENLEIGGEDEEEEEEEEDEVDDTHIDIIEEEEEEEEETRSKKTQRKVPTKGKQQPKALRRRSTLDICDERRAAARRVLPEATEAMIFERSAGDGYVYCAMVRRGVSALFHQRERLTNAPASLFVGSEMQLSGSFENRTDTLAEIFLPTIQSAKDPDVYFEIKNAPPSGLICRNPKCASDKVVWWQRQLSSGDEGMSVFYMCTKCFKEWSQR